MKRFVPLLALLVALLYVGGSLRAPKNPGAFDIVGFGKLPILLNGRLKPLDTVARSSLLQLQGRQRVSTPELAAPFVDSPTEWLLDVCFRPEKADTYPTFAIDNPELLSLLGKSGDALKINYTDSTKKTLAIVGFLPGTHRRFSFNDLQPHFRVLDEQAKLANQVESAVRTAFQGAVVQLYGNLIHYQRLRHALIAPGRGEFLDDLLKLQDNAAAWAAALKAQVNKEPHDAAAATAAAAIGERFVDMANIAGSFLVVPPAPGITDPTAWKSAGAALLEAFRSGRVDTAAFAYAGLAHAWRNDKPDRFNKLLELFRTDLLKGNPALFGKTDAETRFNAAQPFYTSMSLYAIALLVAIASWLAWPEALGRAAFAITSVTWLLATAGIGARMWLEGRPPVTNLYSSALFIGWGAVLLCLILERFFKNAIALVAAGAIGFATLLIAHHLSLSGDTLEMMQAVLDSNFWLATHVVIVTAGYSATFLAGFLAIIYVLRGLLTKSLDAASADSLARMVYGILCFATLFSFVGTVLGGIWADQSWGRFWGWDPKENGALMIVIWNALILHARWGGMIKPRGLMCLAMGGNIITAWSWFGTNMLGVGLHSYGFTSAAFVALTSFVGAQLALIALANLPLAKWRSFRATT
ncbi:MAG: hypothetical protein RLZZ15_3632 [Verrucomicrobiota bacterium]|jgi:ABC-type transport system involved in cytochrome c biogenesis permease subunit